MDYIEAFENLRPLKKYGRNSPEKATLLLSVIELYDDGVLCENEIALNEALVTKFVSIWNRLSTDTAMFTSDVAIPFWAMRDEEFWHIIPLRGKEDVIDDIRAMGTSPSLETLTDCVQYVALDDDLYFLITMASGRKSLKEALLRNNFNLSDRTVSWMAESEQVNTDSFQAALAEYNDVKKEASHSRQANKAFNDQVLDEEVRLTLFVTFYSYLKNHYSSRSLLQGLFSNPLKVYECICKKDRNLFAKSEMNVFVDFLGDLRIALMREHDATSFIGHIDDFLNSQKDEPQTDYSYVDETVDDGYRKNDVAQYEEDNTDSNIYEPEDETEIELSDEERLERDFKGFNYIPKGKLSKIQKFCSSPYDFLWVMAIVDLVLYTHKKSDYTYDEISCMMIADAWVLMNDYPSFFEEAASLKDCIDYLIEESKENMSCELSWDSSKEDIFSAISDYPMSGPFEGLADELVDTAPLNVLKTWFQDLSDDIEIVMASQNFVTPCLYALHIKKFDSFIKVNSKWVNNLYFEHDDLIKYFSCRFLKCYLQQDNS